MAKAFGIASKSRASVYRHIKIHMGKLEPNAGDSSSSDELAAPLIDEFDAESPQRVSEISPPPSQLGDRSETQPVTSEEEDDLSDSEGTNLSESSCEVISDSSLSNVSSCSSLESFTEQSMNCGSNVVCPPQPALKDRGLRSTLRSWAICNNIPLSSVRKLLHVLHPHLPSLPKSEQTLLQSRPVSGVQTMGDGEYYYFGLEQHLVPIVDLYKLSLLPLIFNVDGLPIFKSSSIECWPIMGMVKGLKVPPFVCALWCGRKKPPLVSYLADFLAELKPLLERGFNHKGQLIAVKLCCFVCDAPAKAYLRGTIGHGGYFSCPYCVQRGRWKGRMIFLETNAQLRTDESFRAMSQMKHHKVESPLVALDVDMVTSFPLDYLHLICLGVVRRLLSWLLHGKKNVKNKFITDDGASRLNKRLILAKAFWARDFSRKPRKVDELKRWKATEFRQFILYLAPVVLRGSIVSDDVYNLVILLHVATTILIRDDLQSRFNHVAEHALLLFVQKSKRLLRIQFLAHNVHNLLHIASHCKLHGNLDDFSTFPFENELQVIKKAVRGKSKVIQQIVGRIKERLITIPSGPRQHLGAEGDVSAPHNKTRSKLTLEGTSFRQLTIKGRRLSLLRGDNVVMLDTKEIVFVHNIVGTANGNFIVGKEFKVSSDLYKTPVDSSDFGILCVDKLALRLKFWPVHRILKKMLAVPLSQKGPYAIFPLM